MVFVRVKCEGQLVLCVQAHEFCVHACTSTLSYVCESVCFSMFCAYVCVCVCVCTCVGKVI